MNKQQFELICDDLHNNIEKHKLDISEHLTPTKHMESGIAVVDDSVWSQYINMINPNMYLGTIFGKLSNWSKPVHDKRYVSLDNDCDGELYFLDELEHDHIRNDVKRYSRQNGVFVEDIHGEYGLLDRVIYPKDIADRLVRFCELRKDREKHPIHMLQHKKSKVIYGFVSKDHVILSDKDIHDTIKSYFDNIPCTVQYEHSIFKMDLGIILDEIAMDLGYKNSIKLRLSVTNSMFGRGSASVIMGSFEQWCSNGARGWFAKMKKQWENPGFLHGFELREQHRWKKPDEILSAMRDALAEQIKHGDKYLYLLENAKEITDPLIKKYKDIEKELQNKKINLQKKEVEHLYTLLKTKTEQYKNNGFGVGRAIAEVARDTMNHERKIELEKIASNVMFSQLDPKKLVEANT